MLIGIQLALRDREKGEACGAGDAVAGKEGAEARLHSLGIPGDKEARRGGLVVVRAQRKEGG